MHGKALFEVQLALHVPTIGAGVNQALLASAGLTKKNVATKNMITCSRQSRSILRWPVLGSFQASNPAAEAR